jgi:hypothetical protein
VRDIRGITVRPEGYNALCVGLRTEPGWTDEHASRPASKETAQFRAQKEQEEKEGEARWIRSS